MPGLPSSSGDARIGDGSPGVFSPAAVFLSFLAMFEELGLRPGVEGRVVRHASGDLSPRPHNHAELEVNLVVRGTACYLLGERRHELTAGTLTWLFPGQQHVLVDESADHVLWWAVFRPSFVAGIATASHTGPLLQADPIGRYSRRLDPQRLRRLEALFQDLREAEAVDDTLFTVGLAYLLLNGWQAFLDSEDVVGGVDVHPAVDRVARLLHADPGSGDLAALARIAGLSPSHLSRLFKAQMGISIGRFRNQQRLERFLRHYGNGRRTSAIDAAHKAGFGSYAQFYRVFRQETGHQPTAMRVRHADELHAPPPDHPPAHGPA
jgi:AraC-like DNA-binding protein/quercetin dioxygenase-like cupin family protein